MRQFRATASCSATFSTSATLHLAAPPALRDCDPRMDWPYLIVSHSPRTAAHVLIHNARRVLRPAPRPEVEPRFIPTCPLVPALPNSLPVDLSLLSQHPSQHGLARGSCCDLLNSHPVWPTHIHMSPNCPCCRAREAYEPLRIRFVSVLSTVQSDPLHLQRRYSAIELFKTEHCTGTRHPSRRRE